MATPSKAPPPGHHDAERASENMGRAVAEIRRSLQEQGVPEPSLDEINAEIRRIRAEHKTRRPA